MWCDSDVPPCRVWYVATQWHLTQSPRTVIEERRAGQRHGRRGRPEHGSLFLETLAPWRSRDGPPETWAGSAQLPEALGPSGPPATEQEAPVDSDGDLNTGCMVANQSSVLFRNRSCFLSETFTRYPGHQHRQSLPANTK
jgi:hypothetical protein